MKGEATFSDYKEVKGIMFPSAVWIGMGDTHLTLKEVQITYIKG